MDLTNGKQEISLQDLGDDCVKMESILSDMGSPAVLSSNHAAINASGDVLKLSPFGILNSR